jgi:GAF domain-containing protein
MIIEEALRDEALIAGALTEEEVPRGTEAMIAGALTEEEVQIVEALIEEIMIAEAQREGEAQIEGITIVVVLIEGALRKKWSKVGEESSRIDINKNDYLL